MQLSRNRPFLLISFGQAAFGLGNTFATFVISWVLFDLTGSKMAMSTLYFIFFAVSSLSFLFSGPFLDRFKWKNVMIFSIMTRVTVFAAFLLLLQFHLLHTWMFYVVVFVLGVDEPLFRPSSMAYVAEVVEKDLLLRANSFLDGTNTIMEMIGPLLGGILMTWMGPKIVLLCLICALAISGTMMFSLPHLALPPKEAKQTWWSDFREGLSFYRWNRLLLWLGLLSMVINISFGAFQPLIVPYVYEYLGGDAFKVGLFNSAFSCGMVLGALIIGMRKGNKNLRVVMLGAILLQGLLMMLLGWTRTYWYALVIVVIIGLTVITYNTNVSTMYQKWVPAQLRGRVFTIRLLLTQISLPVGSLLGGSTQWIGYRNFFMLAGALVALASIVAYVSPIFKTLNAESTFIESKTGSLNV